MNGPRVLPGQAAGWRLLAAVVLFTFAAWAGFAVGLYKLLCEGETRR